MYHLYSSILWVPHFAICMLPWTVGWKSAASSSPFDIGMLGKVQRTDPDGWTWLDLVGSVLVRDQLASCSQGVPTRNASGLQLAVPDRDLALETHLHFEHVSSCIQIVCQMDTTSQFRLEMLLSRWFTLVLFLEMLQNHRLFSCTNSHFPGLWPAVPKVLLPLAEPKLNGDWSVATVGFPHKKLYLNRCQQTNLLGKSANLV